MRVLVSLIAAMSFVVFVMLAVAVSRDTGRSPQEIGVTSVVEAAVPSEVACLTCCHDGCRDQYIRTNCMADTADIATVAKVYSLKLPLVSLIMDDNNSEPYIAMAPSLKIGVYSLKLPQDGRTLVVL